MRRNAIRLLLLTGVIALLATVVASSPAAPGKRPAPAGKAPRALPVAPTGPVKADRDRDKVFDDLRARLNGIAENSQVRVIVTVGGPPTSDRIDRLRGVVGDFSVERRYRLLDAFAARMTKRQVEALSRRPEVASVEEDSIVRAVNDSAQESFGVAKARTDAPALDGDRDGDQGRYSPEDLVAAVIDTGIDAVHRDLDEGKVIAFKDFVGGRTEPYDDEGHGTHVAATVAGDGDARADRLYRGVAPDAALVGVKVLGADGEGLTSDVVAALDWVVSNRELYGIEVVNLSLGDSECSDGSDAASAAVDRADAAGLVVAVAAGNEGPGACSIGSPAAARGALTVGAMADTGAGGFYQAYFSSRGRTADGRVKPDISAPGVAITSAQTGTTTGYVSQSGTSMAAPFAAGLALLMRDAAPGLSAEQVKGAMTKTAVDWGRGGDNRTAGSRGADIDYGAGRLDAYAALRSAGAALDAPPPAPVHELREGSLSASGDRVDFPLEVTDTRFPLAATLIISDLTAATAATPDLDLSLLDPTGREVAASRFDSRQEEVGFRPTVTGTYTVRVESYAGSSSFFVDVSGGRAIDTTPAETTIDAGPEGVVSDPTPTFSFSSEAGATFECRLDAGPFAPCSSPLTTAELADGPHTFSVRATDPAGNVDPSPASVSFTVAGSAPGARSEAASGLSGEFATVNATINPSGRDTTFHFQYGPTDAYGARTGDRNAGDATEDQGFSEALAGLPPGSTYHYRIVASNASGTTVGEDRTFATEGTAPPAAPPSSSPPAVAPPSLSLPATSPADTAAPSLTTTVPRQLLRTVLRKGYLRVVAGCSEACRISMTLVLDGRTARRIGLSRGGSVTIGRASGSLASAGRKTVAVRLTRAARRRLARTPKISTSLVATARDAAGNGRSVRRKVTLGR